MAKSDYRHGHGHDGHDGVDAHGYMNDLLCFDLEQNKWMSLTMIM